MKNLDTLASRNPAWHEVSEDINHVQEILKLELGPKTSDEKKHSEITSLIINLEGLELTEKIVEAAVLRKSLG